MEVHHHPHVENLSAGQAGKNFREYSDASEIKGPLFASANKAVLNKYFNNLFQYLRVTVQHRNGLKRLNGKAALQLEYFKNKYHFE